MNYGTLETEIVTRLSAMANVDVVVLPDSESAFKLPAADKARISVAYGGSKSDPVRTTGSGINHSEEITIDIIIQSKSRTGSGGIYAIQEALVARLLGFKPSHCDKILLDSFSFIDHKENVWTYHQKFTTSTLRVELPDDESLVLASMITLEYNDETIVVESGVDHYPLPPI